jgi:DNA polymerase alpha-associated DNA helicase A
MSVHDFATQQLALLAAEQQAEMDESGSLVASHSPAALQRAGLALTNLVLASRRTGLGGKTVLELGPDPATSSAPPAAAAAAIAGSGKDGAGLPEHGLRTGDIVLLAEQPAGAAKKREVRELEKKGARGVVTRVTRSSLGLALNEDDWEGGGSARMWIVKVADDVTFRR